VLLDAPLVVPIQQREITVWKIFSLGSQPPVSLMIEPISRAKESAPSVLGLEEHSQFGGVWGTVRHTVLIGMDIDADLLPICEAEFLHLFHDLCNVERSPIGIALMKPSGRDPYCIAYL
jgi:hypothetical protein